jgi:hypothetical protein
MDTDPAAENDCHKRDREDRRSQQLRHLSDSGPRNSHCCIEAALNKPLVGKGVGSGSH